MVAKTYQLDIPDVGSFTVRRRNMAVSVAITAEYNRLTEGQNSVSDFFGRFCTVYSTLKVLIVAGPEGWNLEELDPDDEESYNLMHKVYGGIREKEDFFRRGVSPAGKAAGAGGSTQS